MPVAVLALSAIGFVAIVGQEGYVDTAKPPIAGDKPTYGFGTTTHEDGSPVKPGERITPPQAVARAAKDIGRIETAVRRCVTVPLTQSEFDTYVSLAYNIGEMAFCQSSLVRLANQGNYIRACKEILRWRYYQGRDCSMEENRKLCGGIWTRRQSESARCLGGRGEN